MSELTVIILACLHVSLKLQNGCAVSAHPKLSDFCPVEYDLNLPFPEEEARILEWVAFSFSSSQESDYR